MEPTFPSMGDAIVPVPVPGRSRGSNDSSDGVESGWTVHGSSGSGGVEFDVGVDVNGGDASRGVIVTSIGIGIGIGIDIDRNTNTNTNTNTDTSMNTSMNMNTDTHTDTNTDTSSRNNHNGEGEDGGPTRTNANNTTNNNTTNNNTNTSNPHAVTVHATASPIYAARAIRTKQKKEALQKLSRQKMSHVYKHSSRDFVMSRVSGSSGSGSGSSSSGAAAFYHSHCVTESTAGVEKLKLLVKTTASVATMNTNRNSNLNANSKNFGNLNSKTFGNSNSKNFGNSNSKTSLDPSNSNSNRNSKPSLEALGLSYASTIPSAFPPQYTFRALAAYTTLRTLSLTLRISPFTPHAFLRALSLPCDCPFLNTVHVQILRNLFAHRDIGRYDARGDGSSRTRLQIPMAATRKREEGIVSEYLARKDHDLHVYGGENLTLLNQFTWPLFYMDYYSMFGDDVDGDDNGDNGDNGSNVGIDGTEEHTGTEEILDHGGHDGMNGHGTTTTSTNNNTTNNSNSTVLPKTMEDMDEDMLGINTPEMNALFQSEPSHIPISQCDAPYKNFEWMDSMSMAGTREDDTNGNGNGNGNGGSGPLSLKVGSAAGGIGIGKGKQKHTSSRRKRRKKDHGHGHGGDSSDNDSEYDEPEAYSFQSGGSSSNSNSRGKRKRGRSAFAEATSAVVEQHTPQFCESEKNPRSVLESVYANVYDYLEDASARRNNGSSPSPSSSADTNTHASAADGHEHEHAPDNEQQVECIDSGGSNSNPNANIDIKVNVNESKKDRPGNSGGNTDNGRTHTSTRSVQMKVMDLLEGGTSSYNLDTEMKLVIIEYLIDELMDVEHIRNELESRMHASSSLKRYEPTCDPEDLENVINEEKCAICGLQGDLLCCDGCPSSYHRTCVGIVPFREFKEDEKWLCCECKIVDAAKLGSLYGGRKCSLDWFTLKDIDCAVDTSLMGDDKADIFDKVEFLIMQGYVFLRNAITKHGVDVLDLLSGADTVKKVVAENAASSGGAPAMPLPLDGSELFHLLQRLGPQVCERWPFSQIPFKPRSVWPQSPERCRSSGEAYNVYSSVPSAYNLFVDENKYGKSPASALVISQVGRKNMQLLRQNAILHPESCLESLSNNTTNDGYIRELIQSYGNDRVSMHSVRTYMMTLERTIFRSSLLHELWGLRNRALEPELWGRAVSICNSYRNLAKLLVRLVDDTHPRALRDEWNLVPGIAQEDFSRFDKESRVYADLSRDWKAEEEKKRRDWEKSLASDVLGLLARESKAKIKKSCRKKKKASNSTEIKSKRDRETISATRNTVTQVDDRKNRRRGREGLTRNAVKVNYVKPLKDLEGENADVIRDAMLFRLESGLEANFEEEGHWPVAGRRLFAPSGSLPTPTVKWLARNAGVKRAHGILYTDRFEIGLPSVHMIWRTKTLASKTFADLLYALQFLDSYLNKNALLSCEKLSSRTGLKEHIQKTVTCSRYDQESGAVEHFVIHKNKWRGCWQSEVSVDSSAFVVFRSCRIKDAQRKFIKRVRATKIEDEESKSIALKGPKVEQMKEYDSRQRKAEDVMLKVLQENIDAAVSPIFDRHRNYAAYLMTQAAEKGVDAIPVSVLKTLRSNNYDAIKEIYWKYGAIGRNLFVNGDVAMKLMDVDHAVTQKHAKSMNNSRSMVEAMPPERQHSGAPYSSGTEHTFSETNVSTRAYFESGGRRLSPGASLLPRSEERPEMLPRVPAAPVQGFPSTPGQLQLPVAHKGVHQALRAYSPLDSAHQVDISSNSSHYRQHPAQHTPNINGLYQNHNSRHHGNTNGYENGTMSISNGRNVTEPRRDSMLRYGQEHTTPTYGSSLQGNSHHGMSNMRTVSSLAGHQPSMYDNSNELNGQRSFPNQIRQNSYLQSHHSHSGPGQRGMDNDSVLQMNGVQSRSGMHSILTPGAYQQRQQFQHEPQQPQLPMQYNQLAYGSAPSNQRQVLQSQVYQNPTQQQPQHQGQYQIHGQRQAQYPNRQMQSTNMNQTPSNHLMNQYGAPQQYDGNRYM